MSGCMMHYCAAELVTLVLANPYTQTVREAGEGFQAGFYDSPMCDNYNSLRLHVRYLSDEPVGGFTVADSTALRIFEEERHSVASFGTNYVTFVPICGGAMHAFFRTVRIDLSYLTYVGIDGDMTEDKDFCLFSTLKHIDRVTEDYIGKWLDGSMPKHQTLGLADGLGQYLNAITATCFVARSFAKDYDVADTSISWGGNADGDTTQGTGIDTTGATGAGR
jgi:basic membrane protein A